MPERSESDGPLESEVDAVIAEFGGDMRQAIRALLADLAALAADYEADVSKGYVQGEIRRVISGLADR